MKTLLYDGDCPFCRCAVRLFKCLGLLGDVQSVPWQEFSGQSGSVSPVLAERIRSEFLLLSQEQVYGGFYAIAQLLVARLPGTALMFRLPGALPVGQLLYKLVSLNRRILAPSGSIACTCDPPFHLGFRVGLWVFLLLFAFAGSILFDASLALLHPEKTFWETAWQLAVSAASGWILDFIIFLPLLYRRYWAFVQQCLVVMAIGIFWLMPVAFVVIWGHCFGLPAFFLRQLTLLGVMANSLIMFLSLERRARTLAFPRWLPWLWIFLLGLVGIPLSIYFRLFA